MIDDVVAKWHLHLRGELPGGLDELLDDDVSSTRQSCSRPNGERRSPRGTSRQPLRRSRVTRRATAQRTRRAASGASATQGRGERRRRRARVRDHHRGQVRERRRHHPLQRGGSHRRVQVMIRPLQAVNLVHQQMQAMLERMNPGR